MANDEIIFLHLLVVDKDVIVTQALGSVDIDSKPQYAVESCSRDVYGDIDESSALDKTKTYRQNGLKNQSNVYVYDPSLT
mmetsp:Transcript_4048/g.6078  ORF Transcript_4048/g.6078 Transcript_4048/m.6078 type:complete len:80 (+) Transcript_4048:45-284(+)